MSQNNAEQIEYWNAKAGETWVKSQVRLDALLEPLSAQALAAAAVRSGERVLDVGCGCGTTTLLMAAAGADVVGVDISAPMLAHARSRVTDADSVTFVHQDASTAALAPEFDLLFSRFGVMFFSDSVAAFRNLHGALKPDGRLCFICWQAPAKNPWMAVAAKAVAPFLPEQPTSANTIPGGEAGEKPGPDSGPFAFADEGYVRHVLESAGFRDVTLKAATATIKVGDNADEAMRFQSEIGPVARVMAELEGAQREAALRAARDALAGFETPEGVNLGACCWIVQAKR